MSGTRRLPVRLTEAEMLDRGRKLASLYENRDALLAEKKTANENYKAREAVLVSDALDVREQITSGYERREVDVMEVFDLTHRSIVTRRCDSLQIVDSRAMTEWELQKALQPELPFRGERVETASNQVAKEEVKANPVTGELADDQDVSPSDEGEKPDTAGELVPDGSGLPEDNPERRAARRKGHRGPTVIDKSGPGDA